MDAIVYLIEYYSPDFKKSLRLADSKPIVVPQNADYVSLESDQGLFGGKVSHKGHWIGYSSEYKSTVHYTTVHLAEIEGEQKEPSKPVPD
ncbi:hypothetical protein [Arenicella xantha]|uniref:Uncharacterized protein n=1 Tax=Arenicella xantha TaxID=644221 RepID=A0A395JLP9_9GAMM|nr:hypothetical protein [Arenicella xantha]RBP51726.1 hypothetical protein DFR28_1021159 [Arenicella xantha]